MFLKTRVIMAMPMKRMMNRVMDIVARVDEIRVEIARGSSS